LNKKTAHQHEAEEHHEKRTHRRLRASIKAPETSGPFSPPTHDSVIHSGHNISSDQIQNAEVNSIAAELKRGLQPAQISTEPKPASAGAQPEVTPQQAVSASPVSDQKASPQPHVPAAQDTITIDQDGTLHIR